MAQKQKNTVHMTKHSNDCNGVVRVVDTKRMFMEQVEAKDILECVKQRRSYSRLGKLAVNRARLSSTPAYSGWMIKSTRQTIN
jgi:monomeric isocitrate dehydrogenase